MKTFNEHLAKDTILVVDDSEVSLYLIKSIFEDDPDIHVEMEINSKNALNRIIESQPDLVILDLMMPLVDGYQLLQQIKADANLNHIPIMVVSARHDANSIKEAQKYNICNYIKKPIDISSIEENIRNILDSKKLESTELD